MKGDDMIRETYLKGRPTKQSKAFTTNPFLHILFLSVLFVMSANNHPYFGAHYALIIGLAAAMAFPAAAYHLAKNVRTFFAARNGLANEIVSVPDFLTVSNSPENL